MQGALAAPGGSTKSRLLASDDRCYGVDMRSRFVIVILALCLGCAHGQLTPSGTPLEPMTPPIGVVRVVAADTLPADRMTRYRDFDGDVLIADAIRTELVEEGLWEEGADTEIDVTVEIFRLRSTGTTFWVGFYAGIDKLEGTFMIFRDGSDPEVVTFKYSGAEDQYLKFSAGARFRSLADALAHDIASHLSAR